MSDEWWTAAPVAEGNWWQSAPVVAQPSAPASAAEGVDTPSIITSGAGRNPLEIGKDLLLRGSSDLTFGTIEKATAKLGEKLGWGSYEDLLARNRAEYEAAGKRIGPTASILTGLAAGGLGAAAIGPGLGLTAVGRIPASAGIVARTAAGAGEGAAYGAAEGLGHTDNPDDYARNALRGAATGALVGGGVGAASSILPRVVTPLPQRDPVYAADIQTLRDAKVPLYASQITNSPNLNWMENAAAKMPLPIPRNAARNQMAAVTQEVANESGVAGRVTSRSLSDAFDTVGGEIGALTKKYPIVPDAQLGQSLLNVANTVPLMDTGGSVIQNFIKRIWTTASDPEAVLALREQLRLAHSPTANSHFNKALVDLKEALDNALQRTMIAPGNPSGFMDAAALQTARQKYANLNVLTDALSRSGQSGARGQLTPSALAAAEKSSLGKKAYVTGRGDLTDLARATQAILTGKEGSGTAERNLFYHLIGAPMTAFAGPVANVAINSRPAQAYLANQLVPGTIAPAAIPPAIGGLLATQNQRRGLLSP